ncbi:hypothetical protein VPH35_052968 [Triticum aestivum]|uniref:Uncharacterized protein n=1 Tax=Triticum aestivum TaxID=4565 RepID=A0A077RTW7_WHEAT|nr:unnamed protein product [Triticum aestivum]
MALSSSPWFLFSWQKDGGRSTRHGEPWVTPSFLSKAREGKGRRGEAPDRGAERCPDPQRHLHRRVVVQVVLEEGHGWMERSMDGGGTLAPHPPMDDDGGGLLLVGWGAKLAVALDARDGLQHLDFKGHHNGNGRMSTMAGVQARFTQTRPVSMAQTVGPPMAMFPAGVHGVSQQLFYDLFHRNPHKRSSLVRRESITNTYIPRDLHYA